MVFRLQELDMSTGNTIFERAAGLFSSSSSPSSSASSTPSISAPILVDADGIREISELRKLSVATASTVASCRSTFTASTTRTSISIPISASSEDHVISLFNPTTFFHIPEHGGLSGLPQVLDITSFLLNHKSLTELQADRETFRREIHSVLTADAASLEPIVTVDRRHGHKLSICGPTGNLARWSVPWSSSKPVRLHTQKHVIFVHTNPNDPRSVVFDIAHNHGAARYTWHWDESKKEFLLEKESREAGRYCVALVVLQVEGCLEAGDERRGLTRRLEEGIGRRAKGSMAGTLVFDERGVDAVVVVATCLIMMKRERQRRAVHLSTV